MEKKFDALKMVRNIRDKHYKNLKGKPHKEVMDYLQQKATSLLGEKLKKVALKKSFWVHKARKMYLKKLSALEKSNKLAHFILKQM